LVESVPERPRVPEELELIDGAMSDRPPVTVSPPALVKPLIDTDVERSTGRLLALAGMHTQSAAAGTFRVDQLVAVAQSESVVPVHVSVQDPGGATVNVLADEVPVFPASSDCDACAV
jgi:hypothetical protein